MDYTRKHRGKSQPLYLVDVIANDSLYEKQYSVMGSTGNVYTVTIKTNPTCTCPDYTTRFNRCKHIYFILLRVMKCDEDYVDEDSYTNSELLEMFTHIPKITHNLVVDDKKKQLYNQLKDKKVSKVDQRDTDDACPVCLDELENGEELDYCKYSCGKPIHKVCYSMWIKKQPANCIYCKASWENKQTGQYVNLL